jgi:hypothetical protein
MPMDMDIFPGDNSNPRRKVMRRTCPNYSGYAPIAAYHCRDASAVRMGLPRACTGDRPNLDAGLENAAGPPRLDP